MALVLDVISTTEVPTFVPSNKTKPSLNYDTDELTIQEYPDDDYYYAELNADDKDASLSDDELMYKTEKLNEKFVENEKIRGEPDYEQDNDDGDDEAVEEPDEQEPTSSSSSSSSTRPRYIEAKNKTRLHQLSSEQPVTSKPEHTYFMSDSFYMDLLIVLAMLIVSSSLLVTAVFLIIRHKRLKKATRASFKTVTTPRQKEYITVEQAYI